MLLSMYFSRALIFVVIVDLETTHKLPLAQCGGVILDLFLYAHVHLIAFAPWNPPLGIDSSLPAQYCDK